MQQVETGSRFWWRALDAQSPEPPASSVSAVFSATAPSGNSSKQPGALRQRDPSFKLQIPRGDRRKLQRRRSKARWVKGIVALAALSGISAATAVAVASSQLRNMDPAAAASARATRTLIALGFGIDQVSVTGHRYTLDADVFDALDLPNVATFASFDAAAALKRIERIAWVDTAQITRVFPGTLTVQIHERQAAAIWTRSERDYLIDGTGRLLGPVPVASGFVLPHVTGEGANTDAPLLLVALRRHKELEQKFSYAERIAERRWAVVLKNGTRVELGADREVEGLHEVANNTALRRALDGAPVVIDVRTPGRIALRPVSAQVTAAPVRPQASLELRP